MAHTARRLVWQAGNVFLSGAWHGHYSTSPSAPPTRLRLELRFNERIGEVKGWGEEQCAVGVAQAFTLRGTYSVERCTVSLTLRRTGAARPLGLDGQRRDNTSLAGVWKACHAHAWGHGVVLGMLRGVAGHRRWTR